MATEWFYQVMGEIVGPQSSNELYLLAQDGKIQPDTLIRKGHDGDWMLADRVKTLFEPGRAAQPRSSPPPLPDGEWHYSQGGQRNGPVTRKALEQLAASGQLKPHDLVWKEGMPNWQAAATVLGLANTRTQAPPPLPQQTKAPAVPQRTNKGIFLLLFLILGLIAFAVIGGSSYLAEQGRQKAREREGEQLRMQLEQNIDQYLGR